MKNILILWVLVFLALTGGIAVAKAKDAVAAKDAVKDAAKGVVVHGHRGSRGTHPENTLPAFQEAVDAGAQVLELDLQLTRDDVPLVSHDPEIGTLCDDENGKPVTTPIPVRTLTFAQIQKYTCGARINPRFPEQKIIPGTRLPSLEAFLTWAKKNAAGLEFNIETKMTAPRAELVADPKLFAERVVALFKKHGVVNKTILQSFDFRTLRAARAIEPKLRLSCLFEDQKSFCDASAAEHATFASPNWEYVTAEEIARCHAKNIQVVPWTANTEEAWKKLLDTKADAIITDYPKKLITYLKNLPHST